MKAVWEVKNLGDVCHLIGGGTPSKDNADFYTGNIPWATVRDMRSDVITDTEYKITESAIKNSSTNIIPSGSVIIATRVGLGKVCLLKQDTAINQDLRGIFPKDEEKLSTRFLFWWLKSVAHLIVAEGTGATVQGVKLPFVKSLQIPLPPRPEQQRIVAILDEAFDAIAAARANAEQNRQNAQALFESYLQSVFNQRGEGWIETTIGDMCTLKSGTSVNVSLEKPTGDLAYVKVSDMSHAGNETEIYSSSRFLNMCDVGKNAIFPVGTTIFPKRGGAILTNKKRLTAVPICADLNIMGVIPPDSLSSQLLYYYFLNVDMKRLGSGSSIPQINNYDIAPLMLSFPENKEQQYKLVKNIDALHKETQRLESLYQSKITALDELKQSLLQQAFSGQL